jgi:uncharacterized protein YjbJ (UPF0337 family)
MRSDSTLIFETARKTQGRQKSNTQTRRLSMNWDRIQGNWKQFKGSAKQQWGKLTDDDFDVIEGQRDKLIGRVQEEYGIAKDEAERQVDMWSRNL